MPGGFFQRLNTCFSFGRSSTLTQCRRNSTAVLTGDQLGPIQQGEHQSFRVRKDGTKLPLPPVLDPVILEERSRWEQIKARPRVENFTPFQKKLWENPYAHALASPVRICRSTNIQLPSELLISLHPRLHPETSDPWLLPVSLTTTSKALGITYRFLNRQLVATHLGSKDNWKATLYSRIQEKFGKQVAKMVWREDMPDLILELMRKKLTEQLKWHFRRSGQLVPCESPREEDIKGVDDVICVLCLGSLKTRADELQAQTQELIQAVENGAKSIATIQQEHLDPHKRKQVSHHAPIWYGGPLIPQLTLRARFPPLEFKMTEWKGSKVAVYSLYDLLGEERLKELLEGSKFEGERCLVMKRNRNNVPVGLLLIQLQAYLAVPDM